MASGPVMLILGCLIAIVLIVFLSNAAPTSTGEVSMITAGPSAPDLGVMDGASSRSGGVVTPPLQVASPQAVAYAPASSSNKDSIQNGETLPEGSALTSKNGKYIFTYKFGRATVMSGNFKMWESTGSISTGGVLKITDDGNIGIFSSAYSMTPSGWSSATAGSGQPPFTLQIRDDGNLVMFDTTDNIVWRAEPLTMPPVGVDCVMGEWTDWSACSQVCGGGTQYRTRSITRPGNEGGAACGPTTETRACNEAPCNDCRLSDWSSWGRCGNPNAQGLGTKTRTKTVVDPGGPGGLTCPTPQSSEMLNQESCQNCVYGPYTPNDWASTPCDAATGIKTQRRVITTPAANGGDACTEPLSRTEECSVACQLAPTADWGACNGTTRTRTTNVTVTAKNGGQSCVDVYKARVPGATVTCTDASCTETQTCAPCVLSTTEKEVIQQCPAGNASGTLKYKWKVATPAVNGGACDQPEITETCPVVNCVQGTTFTYGECDASTGKKSRTRSGDTPPRGGGAECPPVTDTVDCPVDGVCGFIDNWSPCSRACNGKQTRTQVVTKAAMNGGNTPVCTKPEERDCNNDDNSCSVTLWEHGPGSGGRSIKLKQGNYVAIDQAVGISGETGFPRNSATRIQVPDGMLVGLYTDSNWRGNEWVWGGPFGPDTIGGHNDAVDGARVAKVEPIPKGSYSLWTEGAPNGNIDLFGQTLAKYGGKDAGGSECSSLCDMTNGCVGYAQWNNMGGGTWGDCYLHSTMNKTGVYQINGSVKTYKRSAPTSGVTKDQLKVASYRNTGADGVFTDFRSGSDIWSKAVPGVAYP